jgi:hypothetical protein
VLRKAGRTEIGRLGTDEKYPNVWESGSGHHWVTFRQSLSGLKFYLSHASCRVSPRGTSQVTLIGGFPHGGLFDPFSFGSN